MEERKANWTDANISLLVDLVTDGERWAIIRGKFSPSLTIQSKQKVWMEITERVNSSSSCLRTLKDVKKKWQDIQSHTKKKEATRKTEMKRTGGGPPPSELKAWEEKIIGVLSNEILSGIEGGVDSLDTDSNKSGVGSTCMSGKRNFDEMIEDFEDPFSDSKRLSLISNESTMTTTCEADFLSTGEGSKKQRCIKKDVGNTTENAVKDRILQIEENKLRIMKERLSIEKKKLSVLEDYIAWCKNQATTPSVSPVIKGLIEF
ncbi:uncharacterized protein LOC111138144 isoform X1 [Crassostrea virginica]